MNMNELRDRAYLCAFAHGWHKEKKSSRHWLCLVISELMEAVEADRKNKYAENVEFNFRMEHNIMDLKLFGNELETAFSVAFDSMIKNTVEDELADACIRLLDYAGVTDYDLDNFNYENSDADDYSEMTFTEAMYNITSYVMEWDIPETLNEIFAFCKDRNINIFWHIEQKMKYNELRPYKHGNKAY